MLEAKGKVLSLARAMYTRHSHQSFPCQVVDLIVEKSTVIVQLQALEAEFIGTP